MKSSGLSWSYLDNQRETDAKVLGFVFVVSFALSISTGGTPTSVEGGEGDSRDSDSFHPDVGEGLEALDAEDEPEPEPDTETLSSIFEGGTLNF